MTDSPNPDGLEPENPQQSLSLPLDEKDLMRQRVLPVELARVVGVTKQSVSRWIRDGKIAPPSPIDGRLDLHRALRDVLRNTDPGRLRSRVLRQAVEDVAGLRDNLARAEDRAEAAEAALQEAVSRIAFLEKWADDSDRAEEIFKTLIVEYADALRAAPTEDWPAHLGKLAVRADETADGFEPGSEAGDDALDGLAGAATSMLDGLREAPTQDGGGGDCSAADDAP